MSVDEGSSRPERVEEQRLAEWLQSATPEPPRAVTTVDVAERLAQRRGVPWWVPALAAATVVVLVAALAFGLSARQHAAPPAHTATRAPTTTTTSSPQPAPSAPAIPRAWNTTYLAFDDVSPNSLTVLAGRLYGLAVYETYGPHNIDQIERIDPATGRILAEHSGRFEDAPAPVAAGGLVWEAGPADGGTVWVSGFDPSTLALRVHRVLALPGASGPPALAAAADPNEIVVGSGRYVAFVDATTGKQAHGIDVSARVSGTAGIDGVAQSPDGTKLYVAVRHPSGDSTLWTLDPAGGAPLGTPIHGAWFSGLLATDRGVWFTTGGGHSAYIRFSGGGAGSLNGGAGTSGGGLDVTPSQSGNVVWLGGAVLGCADPETGHVRATATVPAARDGSVSGYLSGMTALGNDVYAIWNDFGTGERDLVVLSPPAACFTK